MAVFTTTYTSTSSKRFSTAFGGNLGGKGSISWTFNETTVLPKTGIEGVYLFGCSISLKIAGYSGFSAVYDYDNIEFRFDGFPPSGNPPISFPSFDEHPPNREWLDNTQASITVSNNSLTQNLVLALNDGRTDGRTIEDFAATDAIDDFWPTLYNNNTGRRPSVDCTVTFTTTIGDAGFNGAFGSTIIAGGAIGSTEIAGAALGSTVLFG